MPIVTFAPAGRSVEVAPGGTILAAARRAGLPLASSCRGVGVCDACRVRVLSGGGHLSPPTEAERGVALAQDERLACQACVEGPATVGTSYW